MKTMKTKRRGETAHARNSLHERWTIPVVVDGAPARRFHLTDFYLRRDWPDLPPGTLTLAIDYREGVVLLVRSPRPGGVASATTLAPLSESGDPEPGRITGDEIRSLFREDG